MPGKFYLTTAIPYVNAEPHLGHALEYVVADAIHRYHELIGDNTRITSGADENALKNVQAAQREGLEPKIFLNKYSKIFQDFYTLLGVNLDEFRRGTDEKHHWPGVQKLWKLVDKNGDLYKKTYKGLYCVGCEEFKTRKELKDNKCPLHNKKPELVEEENYFFKLSKYQNKLLKLIENDEYKIYPEKRKREVLSFIKRGLKDFSVSRSTERARGIGVPVPNDKTQKIYVWFDALNIYQTAVGFGYDETLWKKWWPADLHIIGKDIIRFHAIYWPAILLSAKLPLPKSLLVHGFITSGGLKMSKTIGNVINPYEIIEKYGLEPLRYFLLAKIPTLDDGDFTISEFEAVYQADLANGLGNLVARVAKICELNNIITTPTDIKKFHKHIDNSLKNYDVSSAIKTIWDKIKASDMAINEHELWNYNNNKSHILVDVVETIRQIVFDLKPFLPQTSKKIEKQFSGSKIKSGKPLFPRLK